MKLGEINHQATPAMTASVTPPTTSAEILRGVKRGRGGRGETGNGRSVRIGPLLLVVSAPAMIGSVFARHRYGLAKGPFVTGSCHQRRKPARSTAISQGNSELRQVLFAV